MLDLDRLAFAHGDEAATAAVTALGATLAEIGGVGPDRVCLLGDGRIAVALHGLPADAADGRALNVAWSLVAAAATAVRAGDVPVRLDVAVGVSTSTEPIAGELLVRRAELATLDAGTIGRNVTRLFGVRFKPSFAADELGDDVVADDEDLLAALAAHEV
ncbi:MAG: hypothetical protein KDB21_07820 [Acidimicrobiales bacterium]|nr:hypothetical protein [Acidimicrobiales bacterium]